MARKDPWTYALAMSDRERILGQVIRWFGSQGRRVVYGRQAPPADPFGVYLTTDARPGDLVMGRSARGVDPWGIAWLTEHGEHANDRNCAGRPDQRHGCRMLRMIGSEKLCHMSNESFYAFRGLPPQARLEGHQFRFWVKVQKAFRPLYGSFGTGVRCTDVVWTDRHSKTAYIGVRGGHLPYAPDVDHVHRPLVVPFEHNSRTSIRSITEAVSAAVDGVDWADYIETRPRIPGVTSCVLPLRIPELP